MKTCCKCNSLKSLNEFRKNKYKTDGKHHTCKICEKEYREANKETQKSYQKIYRENNKEKRKDYQKIYRKVNKVRDKDKNNIRLKIWISNNKDKTKIHQKNYYIKNYEKNYIKNYEKKKIYSKLYMRKRRANDKLFKLKTNIRSLISNSFKYVKTKKTSKTTGILGCSFEEFKTHLESKFQDWMNWENYGLYNGELNYGWDIDHIIPLCTAKTEEDILRLNNWSNLQPLCSKVNRDIKMNR